MKKNRRKKTSPPYDTLEGVGLISAIDIIRNLFEGSYWYKRVQAVNFEGIKLEDFDALLEKTEEETEHEVREEQDYLSEKKMELYEYTTKEEFAERY